MARSIIISVAVTLAVSALIVVAWWIMLSVRLDSEQRKLLMDSRHKAHVVFDQLQDLQELMQKDNPSDVILVHRGGGDPGEQLNWTIRWHLDAIHIDTEDPKASSRKEVVDLTVHWCAAPFPGRALVKIGEAPKSREAAEMLGTLLEKNTIDFAIRDGAIGGGYGVATE